MFIVRHKSTDFDGTAPVLQCGEQQSLVVLALSNVVESNSGYGGFNYSMKPFFNAVILTFLKNYGVILSVPNIRGGGEFGKEWHLAACKEKKVGGFVFRATVTSHILTLL
jgi:prolyl oligopeptidase